MFEHSYYQNKKNSCIYYTEELLLNKSEGLDDTYVVEYYRKVNGHIDLDTGFATDLSQFLEKFDYINEAYND